MLDDKDKAGTAIRCHPVEDPVGSRNRPYGPGAQAYQQPQQPVRGCQEPRGQRSLPYPVLLGVRLKSLREGGRVDAASVLLSIYPRDGAEVRGTEWGVEWTSPPSKESRERGRWPLPAPSGARTSPPACSLSLGRMPRAPVPGGGSGARPGSVLGAGDLAPGQTQAWPGPRGLPYRGGVFHYLRHPPRPTRMKPARSTGWRGSRVGLRSGL